MKVKTVTFALKLKIRKIHKVSGQPSHNISQNDLVIFEGELSLETL